MKHKFFNIPVLSSDAAESELNSFCDRHRVVDIEKQLIHDGVRSFGGVSSSNESSWDDRFWITVCQP